MSTQKRGLVIAIASGKGGVGKSTSSVNTGIELARQGADVIIIDADKQRTSAKCIERRNQAREGNHNLPVVHCIEKLGDIKATITDAASRYDVVIIDPAGRDSRELRLALITADVIYIPTQASQPDLETLEDLEQIINETQDMNPDRVIRAFVSMAPTNGNSKSDEVNARQFINSFDLIPASKRRTCYRNAYKTSMLTGIGVVEGKDSKAKAEIQTLTKEILSHG